MVGWGRRKFNMKRGNEKKYHNTHNEIDGVMFDSLFEGKVYKEVKEMGYDVIPHPPAIELMHTRKIDLGEGKNYSIRGVKYNPDLLIKHEDKEYYIDVKSFATVTADSLLKIKMCWLLLDKPIYIITREVWEGKKTVEDIIAGRFKNYFTNASWLSDKKSEKSP